jgi:hypothetical protein
VYRRSAGTLLSRADFGSNYAAAATKRRELEKAHSKDPDVEVVILSASSWGALERTHSRYFKSIDKIAADIGKGLAKLSVHWVGSPPPDAADWEELIQAEAQHAIGTGSVKIRRVGDSWWVEAARIGHSSIGVGPALAQIDAPLDYRSQITQALVNAGKRVIGPRSTGDSLSAGELNAIRTAIDELAGVDPTDAAEGIDQSVVRDLIREIDRLRTRP